MRTQVGDNQAIAAANVRGHCRPEIVVQRERMEQHDAGAIASGFIEQLRIAGANRWHDQISCSFESGVSSAALKDLECSASLPGVMNVLAPYDTVMLR